MSAPLRGIDPSATSNRLLKRVFDLLAASLGLIVCAPLMLGVALVVWMRMGRPVLFTQVRPGLQARPFRIFKFRTMHEHAGADGEPAPDEQRLTRLGSWLRCTSLDELPEFWNVVCGDMSLVGPRPLLMEYLDLYTSRQARRHEVRPGLTGWAQINGRNDMSWEEKLDLDVWYVEHHCFALDLRIFARTLATVLRREGISRKGHATTQRFRGSSS